MAYNPFLENNQSRNSPSDGHWLIDLLQSILIAIFIVIIVYVFIVIPNQVSGESMQPNFQDGQLLLTSKVNQWLGDTELGENLNLDYHRGDVVVFQKPQRPDLIKRVIGVPGDTIRIEECQVYINGSLIEEEYLPDNRCTRPSSFATEGETIELGSNEYFLMGDNRDNSEDSRSARYGKISREWIKGRVVLRYLPLNQFGVINTGQINFVETSELQPGNELNPQDIPSESSLLTPNLTTL